MRAFPILSTLVAAAGLAGCFGGGSDEGAMPPAPDPLAAVPAATAVSVGATVDYQIQLAALKSAAEGREPIDLSGVILATSETTEPINLD